MHRAGIDDEFGDVEARSFPFPERLGDCEGLVVQHPLGAKQLEFDSVLRELSEGKQCLESRYA
jgi:hypothetical protein